VLIENRLFFYPKDILAALERKFKPMPDCDGRLHKIWNALREKEEREQKMVVSWKKITEKSSPFVSEEYGNAGTAPTRRGSVLRTG